MIQARLTGQRVKTGGRWEGLFLRELSAHTWEVLGRTRGHPAPGEHVVVGQGLHLVLESKRPCGSWIVKPECDQHSSETAWTLLEKHGQTPLPPYIRRGLRIAP